MTVRIANDFWDNYEEHEELLRKCFMHIYLKKFPVHEGSESAFNFLIAEFFRKKIFERFDASRKGKFFQTQEEDKSIQKKFEQYVYKWTESIMFGMYSNARNYSSRNLRFSIDKVETLTETSYANFRDEFFSDETMDEIERSMTKERVRKFPTIADAEDFHGETPMSAHDEYYEKQLYSHLESVLKDDRERAIIAGKKEGLNNSTVGEMVGITPSQVTGILKGIRSRCTKILA